MNRIALQNSINDYDQKVFIKFCVLLNKSAKEIQDLLSNALNKTAYPYSSVTRWVRSFKSGRIDIEEARGGAHNIHLEINQRVDKIKGCLDESRNWSVRELALRTEIPKSAIYVIFKEIFDLSKILGKWVPRNLTKDQKEFRVIACRDNLLRYNRHKKLLNRTLAIDETWVSMYTPPSRDKAKFWLKPGEQLPILPQQEKHERKRMLIMAMDINGIAFWELCEEGSIVNAEVYKNFLERNIPNWMANNNIKRPIISHDNARPHIARIVTSYFDENNIDTWIQPPYSPDIQPCDFNCFGPLKRELKGNRYNSWSELINAINSIVGEGLHRGLFKGVKMLPDRWKLIIDSNGEYI